MINAATTATLFANQAAIPGATLPKAGKMTEAQATTASKDFEAMFLSEMLGQMFGDSVGTDAFGDADSSEIYKGMMVDAYGKEIGKSGGIGIADYVKKELLKIQETNDEPGTKNLAALRSYKRS